MRTRIGIIFAAVSVVSSTGGVPARAAALEGAAIVRGAGRVRPDGTRDWRATSTADVLTTGITVQAAPEQPLEMTLPDGVTLTLEPKALARWMPGGKLPSETNHWTYGYHLLLEDGELEVRMPPSSPKGAHAFLVSTKAGTLTDWRGQLHVRVRGEATAAAIYEGALVVGSNGQGFPVYDGAGILMHRGVNPDKTRGIPAPPEWAAPGGRLAVVAGEARAPLDLAWKPVANAAEYRVEVALDPSMVRVIERATTEEPRFTATTPGDGGSYWVHVRAVGAEGIVGAWSAARPMRVIHYDLPEGAFVARDGALVLPDGAHLTLPGGDGLEVAYESFDDLNAFRSRGAVPLYWGRFAGQLGLAEHAPVRLVHLRDATLGGETLLLLARRQLRADVHLGPSNARWPLDSLDARIEITDPSGRIDVVAEAITVQTMLDVSPIPLAWKRDGSTLSARIPPEPIAEPSIVRVVVKDGRGSEIGRGFLELEPAHIEPKARS